MQRNQIHPKFDSHLGRESDKISFPQCSLLSVSHHATTIPLNSFTTDLEKYPAIPSYRTLIPVFTV